MKYSIKFYNDWDFAYENNPGLPYRSTYSNEYTATEIDVIRKLLCDEIDAPLRPMTFDEVKHDFSSRNFPVSDEELQQVMRYYNGRLEIRDRVLADLDADKPGTFQYEIPYECNHFYLQDPMPPWEKMRQAYILLTISE